MNKYYICTQSMPKSSFVVSLFYFFLFFKLDSHNKQLLAVCHDFREILSSKVVEYLY